MQIKPPESGWENQSQSPFLVWLMGIHVDHSVYGELNGDGRGGHGATRSPCCQESKLTAEFAHTYRRPTSTTTTITSTTESTTARTTSRTWSTTSTFATKSKTTTTTMADTSTDTTSAFETEDEETTEEFTTTSGQGWCGATATI